MTRPGVGVRDLLTVAAGTAIGATLRWAVGLLDATPGGVPWPTLAGNVAGAFALGLLPVLACVRRSAGWRLFVGPGLLGGFTTVSAFAEESRALAAAGRPWLAAAYVLATVAAGLVAAAAGRRIAAGRARVGAA